MIALAAAALATGALLAGCPAAHDPFPDRSCKSDTDCFLGERCNALSCESIVDLAMPDVALPFVDFSTPSDGGGDL